MRGIKATRFRVYYNAALVLVGGTFAKTSERYNFFLNNSDFHQNLFPQSDDGEGTFRDKEIAKIIAGGDIALQNR